MLPGSEVRPDPQDRQVAEPESGLYFPDTHSVQGPLLGPVKPPVHTQLVCVALPAEDRESDGHETHAVNDVAAETEEKVPLGQSTQEADPSTDLYLPARHFSHVPLSRPVWSSAHMHTLNVVFMLYPALQVQSENFELFSREVE